jgi:hypothetical protein
VLNNARQGHLQIIPPEFANIVNFNVKNVLVLENVALVKKNFI